MKAYERASEILKPYTAQRAIKKEGHFAVNDNNTYNVLADSRTNIAVIKEEIKRTYQAELLKDPELWDIIEAKIDGVVPSEQIKSPFSK